MSRGIRVSEQHGVNPSLGLCYFCQEAKEVILFGRLPGDEEAPRQVTIDREPCDKCKKWMEQGVIVISVRDGESGDNPYRSGGWFVLKDDAIRRMGINPPELLNDILKRRVMFMPDEACKHLGLMDENGKPITAESNDGPSVAPCDDPSPDQQG